jgi:hypothetical protein
MVMNWLGTFALSTDKTNIVLIRWLIKMKDYVIYTMVNFKLTDDKKQQQHKTKSVNRSLTNNKSITTTTSHWKSFLFKKTLKRTSSKLKWTFPFCEKYDQIKETPLKYTIFPSKIKLLNFFLCLYCKANWIYSPYLIVFFKKWKSPF